MLRGVVVLVWLCAFAVPAAAVRVKDLGHFDGVRKNALIGYGLVVGLDGTGDSERAGFSAQSLEAMLSRLGVRVDKQQLQLRNVAAVTVTAELPPFSRPGITIDVQVSSIGDARSLVGGTLLMSPLRGANGETYALAQGPVMVGSEIERSRYGRGSRDRLNVGRVPAGALVEREVKVALGEGGVLRFVLARPDFKTAANMADAINRTFVVAPAGRGIARPLDAGDVEIAVPADWSERIAAFIALVEEVDVTPDALARVVISATTGAVVLGGEVRLSRVAVAYGGVSIEIDPDAPRPPADELIMVDQGATLGDVVRGLNQLGVGARGLVDILQALSSAGALHAELEVTP